MIDKISVKDLRSKYEPYYITQVERAIARGTSRFNAPFYIQMKNAIRTVKGEKELQIIPFDRESCPTPGFDETVYKFDPKAYELKLLWTLPKEKDCLDYYHNKEKVHPSEYCLLDYVVQYFDGSLFKLVDRMEHEDGRAVQ